MLKLNLGVFKVTNLKPYLNTSYVEVKRFEEIKYQSTLDDLNTSYVEVKQESCTSSLHINYNLNTSYVEVKP